MSSTDTKSAGFDLDAQHARSAKNEAKAEATFEAMEAEAADLRERIATADAADERLVLADRYANAIAARALALNLMVAARTTRNSVEERRKDPKSTTVGLLRKLTAREDAYQRALGEFAR